jgi:hypothetical protein
VPYVVSARPSLEPYMFCPNCFALGGRPACEEIASQKDLLNRDGGFSAKLRRAFHRVFSSATGQ